MRTGRDGDDGVGDLVSEVGLGGLLHLSKNHGGNLLGGLEGNQSDVARNEIESDTYKFLSLSLVLNLDNRLSTLLLDFEGPVLDVAGHVSVVHLASNETLGIEDSVFGVGVEGVLSGITDTEQPRQTHG